MFCFLLKRFLLLLLLLLCVKKEKKEECVPANSITAHPYRKCTPPRDKKKQKNKSHQCSAGDDHFILSEKDRQPNLATVTSS